MPSNAKPPEARSEAHDRSKAKAKAKAQTQERPEAHAGDRFTVARELESLSPEQAELFLLMLEKAMRKRRILLIGYLLALLSMLVGFIVAVYVYGTHERGQFVGWIFLLPFLLVGLVLLVVGRWAKRL